MQTLRTTVLLGSIVAGAMAPWTVSAQWVPVRSFGSENGLPQSQVMAITQDCHGYLWLATQGGVARFNGLRFDSYGMGDGLPDNVLTAIAAGQAGTVWLGADSGQLARWDGTRFDRWPAPDPQPRTITGLYPLGPDSLLVGSGGGLWRWSPTGAVRLLDRPVAQIAAAAAGDASGWPWVLADTVLRFDGERLVPVPAAAACGPATVLAPLADGVWCGTGDGVVSLIGGSGVVRRQAFPGRAVSALLAEPSGDLWVGATDGLWRLHPDGRAVRQPLYPNDPSMEIRSLYRDREGDIWISPWSGGLFHLVPDAFAVFDRSSGFPTSQVWGFQEDEQGCVWMATEDVGALRWCEGGLTTHLRAGVELPPGRVMSVEGDGAGGLFLGCAGGVVHWSRQGQIRRFTTAEGLPANYARVVFRDRAGSLWVGTRAGLARLDGDRFSSWTRASGMGDDNLRGLAGDAAGNLWIATHGAGVLRFDGQRFTAFTTKQGLPHDRVWSLTVDSRDQVWAGTDAGIWIHPIGGGRDVVLGEGAGLPNLSILFLAEDQEGLIWAGSTNGLSRLSAQGKVLLTLTAADGLAGSEAEENGVLVDRSGVLWVATSEGVTRLKPRQLPRNQVPPPPVVERVLVNGEKWAGRLPIATDAGSSELVLPPSTDDVRLEFAGLSFRAPEQVRYRFMLEGLDAAIGRPTDERHVTYRHLPPGHYRFVVSARNNDGLWSPTPATVPIRILPAWYQTWWFRGLAAAALVAAAFAALLVHDAGQRRRRRLLEKEVAARTAELAEANQRISEQNRQLADLSRTDALTGLGNRRVLAEQLPLQLALVTRQSERLPVAELPRLQGAALLMVDLDRFKSINDRFGHEVGDLALIAVADTLRRVVREVDLAVRWGGEELVVLARGIDQPGLAKLAERLLQELTTISLDVPGNGTVSITASIGFLPYPLSAGKPLPAARWGMLLDTADRLMYLAKERGRARACGLAWRDDIPPAADEEELLQRIAAAPGAPPSDLRIVEIVLGA